MNYYSCCKSTSKDMIKAILTSAILTSSVYATPREDAASDINNQIISLNDKITIELSNTTDSNVGTGNLESSYRSFYNKIAAFSNTNLRQKYAKIYATIYENAYNRSQRLVAKIDRYDPITQRYIRSRSWYKRFIHRMNWYKAEAQKYLSLLNIVTEVSRTTAITERTDITKSAPVLINTKVEEITEYDSDFTYIYKETVQTFESEVTETIIQTTTTTITYSNNATKVETSEHPIGMKVSIETTTNTQKELISMIEVREEPIKINWRTSEYLANYGLDMIGAETAYQQGWTGEGITVAVLDSGIDTDHPDLSNIVAGYNFVSNNTDVEDDHYHYHGTHIAGIIAANRDGSGMHGVAFDASIMPLKVLDANGGGKWSDFNSALTFAQMNGAKVANLSLGKAFAYNVTRQDTRFYDWLFGDTYKQVVNNDLSIVVSAGNDGLDCMVKDATSKSWVGDQILYCVFPAALPYINGYEELTTSEGAWITVGAVDSTGEIASYSNKAGVMKDYYLVAPGSEILSTDVDGGYMLKSGTSMAAPHVSGAFALLAQKFPYLVGKIIADILFVSATDLGETGIDDIYGHGLLNITAAMAPIGDLNIPLGNTTTGKKTSLTSSYVAAPAAFASALMESEALAAAIIVDDYERAYNVDMTDAVSMMSSTYSFDNYRTANIGDIIMGFPELKMEGQHPLVIGYQMSKSTNFLVGRESGIFGAISSGALSFGEGSTWYSRLQFNNYYHGIEYGLHLDYGFSAGQPVSEGYITRVSDLHGIGFGANARRQFGRNEVAISLLSPISIVKGSVNLAVSNGRTMDGQITYNRSNLSLQPNVREYKLGASYIHRLDNKQTLGVDLNSTINAENIKSSVDNWINLTYRISF